MGIKNYSKKVISLSVAAFVLLSLVVGLPTVTQAVAPDDCPADMIGYWKLNEDPGPDYLDSYGANDATCTNCPSPVAGLRGGAQSFDKIDDEVNVPYDGSDGTDGSFDWGVSGEFSIEFWMNSSSNCSGNEVIVGRQGTAGLHWWVGCWDSGDQAAFVLLDENGNTGGNGNWPLSGTVVSNGKWHHIVAVKDATHIRIYVDGQEKGAVAKTYQAGFGSTTNLNLGHLNYNPTSRFRYNGILDEVAIYNRALNIEEIRAHYFLPRGYCEGCDTPIKIMPLGDSITVGNASGVVPDDDAHYVSYRKVLWESLEAGGYDVDFVGGQTHGFAFDPPFDSWHEGHGGWTDTQIRDNVTAFLTANPADVVLLHIGTNGLDPSEVEVNQILDNIDAISEDITVVLARIINRRDGSTTTTQFNVNVANMAQNRIDAGDKIIIVDMEDGAGIIYGPAPGSGDMWDNLHPYKTGYEKMAYVWLEGDSDGSLGLSDFLPPCLTPLLCPADMISYWKLDEIGSPSSYDDFFDGNDGACAGTCPSPGDGIINGGQVFSRGGGTGLNVAAADGFNWGGDESFTIEYWMQGIAGTTCAGSGTSNNEVMVGRDDGNLHWWTGCANTSGNALFVIRASGGSPVGVVEVATPINDGNWHHVAAVHDGANDMVYLYVDGTNVNSDGFAANGNFSTTDSINIGWLDLSPFYHFSGTIDEVAIYNRVLSAAEIEQQFTDGLAGLTYCEIEADTDTDSDGIPDAIENSDGCCLNPNDDDTDDDGILDGNEDFNYDCVIDPDETDPCHIDSDGDGILDGIEIGLAAPQGSDTDPLVFIADADGGATMTNPVNPDTDGDSVDDGVEDADQDGEIDPGETDPTVNDNCPADMIGYWTLDETGTPTSFEDRFGSYDGACSPFGCPVPVAGQVNGGQQIAGGSTGVGIDIPADPSGTAPFDWAADQSFSISFWMNRSGTIGVNDVIIGRDEQGPGASSLHWWIGVDTSGLPTCNLIATNGDGAAVTGTTNINDGNWHHVVFVRDAAAGVNLIYIDGNQTPEGSTAKPTYSAGFDSTTAAINIGWLSLNTIYTYDGKVDEVALYNQALAPVEIEQQYMDGLAQIGHCESTYEPPPCPAETTGYWRLDETGTPTSFEDFVGGNTAACAGACPAPAGGIVNGGQVFSLASGTGLDVAATDELNWGVDDSFSVEFWMTEPGDISGNAVIIGRQGPSHPNPHIWIGVNSGGVANFSLHANDTDEAVIQGSTNLTTGGWHHIVAVRERTATTDQIRIYVDSAEEGVLDHTFSSGFETTTPLNIGWLNLGGGFRYDGKLDEVAIYKRALTVAEIEQHYTDGLAGFAYCEVYPVLDTDSDGIPDDVESAVGCCLNPNDDDTDDDGIIDGNEDLNYDCVIDPGETDPCVIDTDGDGIDDGIEIGLAAPQGSDTDPLVFNADADGGATTTNPVNPDTDGDGVDDGIEDANQNGAVDAGETDPAVNENCPADMTAYYMLDESTAPYADYQNGPDATCTNCPAADVDSVIGGAQAFDGANDEVNVVDADQFDWAADDSFTIEYWMKKSTACGGNEVIIGRDDGSGLHWWTGCQGDGTVRFQLKNSSDAGLYLGGTGDTINDGDWHHLVFVRDESANENRIYVDGVNTHSGNYDYTAGFGSSVPLNIGYLNAGGHYRYDGLLDEVAFYNRALSPEEIEQHYCNRDDLKNYCVPNYRWMDAADQVFGQEYRITYNYDPASVDISYDALSDTLRGTLTATNLKPNFAYQLKLVGNPEVDYIGNKYIGLAGRWWQEEWNGTEWTNGHNLNDKGVDGIFPNPNDLVYFEKHSRPDPTSPTGLKYRYTGYMVFDYFITDSNGNAVLDFEITSSYHVLWKTSQRSRSSEDGPIVPASFDADLSSEAYDIDYPPQTVDIYGEWERLPVGGVNLRSGEYFAQIVLTEESFHGNECFAGNWETANTVDVQFRIVNEAACPAEMISYWKMDDATAPYADYLSGPDATCTNCPAADVDSVIGGAQAFDGANDEVNVADTDQFDWAADDSFTIEYWMKKSTACGGNEVIIGRDDGSGLHWWTGCQGDGTVRFQLKNSSDAGLYLGGTGDTINDGDWHHLVFVRDESANENRIYVDGVNTHSGNYDYTAGFGSSVPLNIGYLNAGGHYRYDGLLDEVAFYNRALSPDEIEQHYLNGEKTYGYCEAIAAEIISLEQTEGSVGQPYTYDVDAIGNPSPTFTLVDGPAGMTIDPNTGVIEWMPAQSGDEAVTIKASNSYGAWLQIFTIHVTGETFCPPGMTSFWKLDETGTPTIFEDYAGSSEGTCSGTCPTPTADAQVVGAQVFDGSSTGIDASGAAFDWDAGGSFSIEFWMRRDNGPIPGNQISDNEVIIGRDYPDPLSHWWFGLWHNGAAHFQLTDNSGDMISIDGPAVDDSQWHHLVGVRDGVNNINRLFVDGVEVPGSPVGHTYSNGFGSPAALNIGWLAPYSDFHFEGTLDEIAVYDRALTAAEIQHHFTNGQEGHGGCEEVVPQIVSVEETEATVGQPYTYDVNATGNPAPTYALTEAPAGMTIDEFTGLIEWTPTGAGDFDVCVDVIDGAVTDTQCFTIQVAGPTGCPTGMAHYWKLDESIGSTFEDAYGGTDGTCTDCPTRVDGILGSARSFNGSSNEINVPDDGSFDWGASDEFSIEYWMKTDPSSTCSGNEVIVGRQGPNTSSPHWWTGCSNGGNQALFVLIDQNGDNGGNGNWPAAGIDITDGIWHHVVAVKDATHIHLYVDGVKTSVPKSYTGGFTSTTPINIGYLNYNASNHFRYEGFLDEVGIYNKALTEAEILEHYNEGAGRGYCSPATPPTDVNLASYWKLDETAPSFYEDIVGSNDGGCRAPSNCPTPTTAGKLAGGQIFDRSLQTGINAPGQDFNWSKDDSFTVAFWMNKDSACSGSATGNNEVIVGRDDSASELHWWVGVGCNSTYPQQGGAAFNLIDKNTGEANTAIYGETDLTDGEWHLVVAQRDGLLQENRLYVDGKLESKVSISYSDDLDSATEPINIGWLNLSPGYHYTGILDEVANYNSALSEPEIRFLYYLGRDYRDRCSQPIKVMELGDSITYDNYGGDTRSAGLRTGYRSHLWWMLTDAGYNVDFVGSVVAGQDYVPAFDPDNAGYPGATDDQIVGLLQTGISPKSGYPGTPTPPGGPYLDYYQPDIILLHIGTNGLCSSGPVCADAVANILDEVDDYELRVGKEAVVLVARIIARQNDSCSVDTDTIFGSSTNTSTSNFNNFVEDMVLNRIAGGDNVILLDMECGANINYITEMIDSLHPDPFLTFFGGYEKMADVWMNGNSHEDALGLTDLLPVCGPPEPTQPVITSEPVLQAYSGWFYKYDVDADGYPAPEYRLVESPPDMTIDSANGIITWLAGDIGPYDVIVEAYNSEASIPQEFTIQVEEAPPCPVDMNHYLKLDEDTSGIYNDLFSSNNGECAGNCPDPDIGIVSGAQVFNRSAGTGINVPADTSFDWGGSESFSIEFWMKKDPGTEPCSGSDTNANEVLVGRDDASTQLHWWVGVGCNTSYPTQGGAVFNLIDTNAGESGTSDISGQTGTSVYGSTNLIDGTWHHIVVARDGLVNRLFVDGILEDALTLPYSNGFESASAPINIGWLNLSNGFRFSGTLDEVAMYNRALQEPEIQEHYSNGLCSKGYCEPIVPVTVPNVVGLPQAEAEAAIAAADLRVGTVTKTPSDTIPIGEVINQSPVDGVEVPSCSAVDIEVSLGDVSYFQDFEGYEVGDDPVDWLDTGANNSLTEDDSLFKTADVDGDMAFGTSSTLTNIHSHYLAETYDAMEGFVFTGRIRMSASNSGIGVTFLSDYPDSDTYYRLRRYGTNAFHLSSHNTAALSGVTDSGVIPAADTWYLYKIEVTATDTQTRIRAKVWEQGTGEPGWQIDAYDDGANRLTSGKIGLWSHSAGGKNWDDIAVEILGPVNQPPVAVGGADPVIGEAPLTVNFNADGSHDDGGSIVLFEWDYETDGIYDWSGTTSGSPPPHTYTAEGTYTATLRVTDNEDATDTDTVTIEVVAVLATVPDCVGLSHAEAQTALTAEGLTEGTVSTVYHATVPDGDVISQNPSAGESVPGGSAVDLEVSLGPAPMVDVPYCVGLSQAEAETAITGAGLTVGAITTAVSDTVAAGDVISQNPADGTSVPAGSAVDLVVSLGEAQGFEEYAVGDDPVDWLDTGANNSLTESDLFEVFDLGGENVFGTASTLTNIHSHYLAETYDAMEGFVFTGRMRMSASNSGIGVTFLSDYPDSDTYYRLRRYGTNGFHLSSHNTAALSGVTDSGVIPAVDTWYWYRIEVIDTGTRTEIRAKIWQEGSAEPAVWQIDAYDDGPNRLTSGKIGLWSFSSGSKYWDDIAVEILGPVNQPPVAVGGADPVIGEAPLTVNFNADGSHDDGGSIVLFEWDYETDGIYDWSGTTSGSPPPHTYTAEGTYTATLRVTDNEDATDTDAVTIEVVAVLATVPDCVGLSHAEAQTALTAEGLTEGTVSTVYHATVPDGDVISQNPSAGESVPGGSAVDLEVSLGPAPMVDVPYCVGLSQAEAETAITGAGLTVGAITTAVSDTVAAGDVISQNPADGTSVPAGSAVDLVVSLGEAQGFEEYAVGDDPVDWLDTGANNSLTESDLFEVFDLGGENVFGTASTLTNIHSHYLAETYDAMEGFVFTGRMRMSASNSGIGVTFLSDYPDSDTYYRLRRYRTNAFHLSPHGTDPLSGTLDSDVIPAADTWYFYKIEVTATVAQTQIRAKVWEQGTGEPADWQIDAYDDGPNRLTSGKIGLWSYSAGSKYWDDLAVVFLTP